MRWAAGMKLSPTGGVKPPPALSREGPFSRGRDSGRVPFLPRAGEGNAKRRMRARISDAYCYRPRYQ